MTTGLIYDSENRLVKVVDPMGYDTNLSYSTVGAASQTTVKRLQGISPATYMTTTFLMTTDGMGAVAKVTDALNNVTQVQYDANENVTQVTDPNGRVSTSTYDGNGNVLTHIVDPGSSPHLNLTTTTTYDTANNVLTATNPLGVVTQITYDSPTAGDPVKVIADYVNGGPNNSDTNVTANMTYDSFGEVLTSTDPLGVVTKTTYDTQGDVLTTTANYQSGVTPDFQTNVTTSSTYDVLGQRLTATNPLGIVTQYTYDNMGRLLKTIANYQSGVNPDQQTNVTTSYGYDALNRQVTVTDPLGIVTQTVYDADGRVTQTVLDYVNGGAHDTQTNVVISTQSYDAAGNVLSATDAKGNVTTTTYDLANHPLKTTQKDNSGTVLQNGQVVYDAAGQVIERDILDANSAVLLKLTYGFDGAGRNTTTTLPAALPGFSGQAGTSTVSTTTYDAGGQALEAKTTNAGLPSPSIVNDATVTYDHLGHVLSKTEQANTTSAQTTSFAYDLNGHQTSVTDPAGKITSSTYDALGAVLTTTHPDGTVDTMTYDAAGELLSTANSAGTTKDTFDPLGRITYDERDDSTGTLQTGVTTVYDANGNKTQQQTVFPGGTNTTYRWTYDRLNRAATMSDGTRSYAYDLNSNVTQMKVAVGSSTIGEADYTYDGANRLTGLTAKLTTGGTTLHTYGYTYDALGNRNQITTDGTATTYTYDNLTQLTKVQVGGTTATTYSYDANSNRTQMTTSAGNTTYNYDSSDTMLVSKQDPNGKITNYSYDANGNLLKTIFDPSGANQVTGYVYDKQNRLTEVDQPNGNKVQFTYDADGNRISKTVTVSGTSTTIKDVYALGHISEQTDASGNPLATFTYEASGRPASVVLGNPSTGTRYYYVYNGHSDVVALTDSSGTVVASYSYDAFGVLLSSSENFPGGWSNPYRFDGADLVRYDSETGLYWMSVRAYDPTLGRFISHDPLGRLAAEGIDFAPYVYTGNNPVNRTDPSGQRWIDESGDTAWTSNGSVYVQTPGTRPKVVAKIPVRTPAPTCGGGGGGTRTSAHVCTQQTQPVQTTCNATCQNVKNLAKDAKSKLQALAAEEQDWIDRLNGNDSWYWLGVLGGLAGNVIGKTGWLGGVITLYSSWTLYQVHNDAIQIFTTLRDMLNKVASDFGAENTTGWKVADVLNFQHKEDDYIGAQIDQLKNIDVLSGIFNPILHNMVNESFGFIPYVQARGVVDRNTCAQANGIALQDGEDPNNDPSDPVFCG